MLLACYLFSWIVLFPDEFSRLGKHLAGGAAFVSNIVLLFESGYFDTSAQAKPLLHLWSLGIEEQFYIFWPLLLWIFWKARLNVFVGAAVLASASFVLGVNGMRDAQTMTFFSPITRFWELLAGGLLAYAQRGELSAGLRFPPFLRRLYFVSCWINAPNTKAALGGLLIVTGLTVISEHKPFPGWRALLPVLGAVLMISAGGSAWINRAVLSNRLMVWIGLISFPLYLWHWPLLSFMHILNADNRAGRMLAVVVSVALAWLTFVFVEKPLRFGFHRRMTLILCVLMFVVFLVGLATEKEGGLESRTTIMDFKAARESLNWPSLNNFEANCIARFKGSGYCTLAKDAPATVALIGDSQANHFFLGLAPQYLAIGENLVNLGCGACPPLFDTTSRYVGKTPIGMATMDLVLKTVIDDPRIHTVILAANWHLYLQGTRFSDESKSWPLWEIRSPNAPLLQDNNAVFELQMAKTIAMLQAAGKKLIVIKQIPELNYLPSICLPPRPFSFVVQNPECLTPIALVNSYLDQYQISFDRLINSRRDIVVWDPKSTLCDKEFCTSMKGKNTLYRDELHLSEFGSIEVGRGLFRDFASAHIRE